MVFDTAKYFVSGPPEPEHARRLMVWMTERLTLTTANLTNWRAKGWLPANSGGDERDELATAAFDLVATRGLILRLRPGWYRETALPAVADHLLAELPETLALAAEGVVPLDWLDWAGAWLADHGRARPRERARMSYTLLAALDEMWVVQNLAGDSMPHRTLRALDDCVALVAASPQAFTGAVGYVRETVVGLDPRASERGTYPGRALDLWRSVGESVARDAAAGSVETAPNDFPVPRLPLETARALLGRQGEGAARVARESLRPGGCSRWRGVARTWEADLVASATGVDLTFVGPQAPGQASVAFVVGRPATVNAQGSAQVDLRGFDVTDSSLPALVVVTPDGTIDVGVPVSD